jgi:hypothetical protein
VRAGSPGGTARQRITKLSRAEEEHRYYEHLLNSYTQVRRFLPTLLQTIQFAGGTAAQPALRALTFLQEVEGKDWPEEGWPREVVTKGWQKSVFPPGERADKRFYTLCALERLQDGLHRRDIHVSPSERWGDPVAKLLQGAAWESARASVCSTLNRQPTADKEIRALEQQLEQAYRRAADSLGKDSGTRIERVKGKDWRSCQLSLYSRMELPRYWLFLTLDTAGEFKRAGSGARKLASLVQSAGAMLRNLTLTCA